MRAALKLIMILTGLLLLGLAVGVALLAAPLEKLARYQVEQRLGEIYGSPVTLARINVLPRDLAVELVDLAIHNPPKFTEGEALHCSRLLLFPELSSLLSSTLRLRKVQADGVLLNLRHEIGTGTNVGALLQASRHAPPEGASGEAEAVPEAEASETASRSVTVENFVCSGARVTLSSSLIPVGSATLEVVDFTEDLSDRTVSPGTLAHVLLRSLLVKTITVEGPIQPLVERLQEELI